MVDKHQLEPFLPHGTRLLMLGSFPPQQKRWSMEFFYPNFNNDMWRIFGKIFRGDSQFFVDSENKCYRRDDIVKLLEEKGIGLYDTATEVIRRKDNASDKYLEILEPTDVRGMLSTLEQCRAVVATGQKAADEIGRQLEVEVPKTGMSVGFELNGRQLLFFRMPSSSRAYPLSLDKKVGFYRNMFEQVGLL